MRLKSVVLALLAASGMTLVLAGCGDSYPLPESSSASPASPPLAAYAATNGVFKEVAPVNPAPAAVAAEKCNLDAVNGAPAGSNPLTRGSQALFAGWAASGDAKAVPATVEIVLHGAHDYAVTARTGAPRPDVASANGAPALAQAGYAIHAGLGVVSAGSYQVVLRYSADGKAWRCATPRSLTIR